MKTITKICTFCNESFEADVREHNRGNAKYCSLSCCAKAPKNIHVHDRTCINCNHNFKSKCADTKYCTNSCKQQYRRKQIITKNYATKSLQRILGHLPCELCGWSDSIRDVHHIIPVSKGGKNTLDNVLVLCPNHHRMIHHNLVSEEAVHAAVKLRLSLHPEFNLEQDAHAGN